ncbi:MAG TPA: Dna2/Cas4 domain-containing protein, partial [Saprospiraceae bacterium]|nr:Dna2/Cas4 domain-containing protein [Saprospiraceae bacterium]
MEYSASHITYYHLCHRKLWMHHKGLRQEDNSQAVGEGKLIGKESYTRRATRWRELDLGFLKIDHFDAVARVVREVKKSPKLERAHVAQVQYY